MEAIEIIEGPVSFLDRSDVDTDQIIPKQFLKRVERTGFGEFLFYDWMRDGEIELEPNPILVSGRNFGSGSSREHAVWALHQFGFSAVVACLNNTGPGLNQVGPATTFAVLSDVQTWVCTFAMLLGRLEIFTLFVLISPAFWRR